MKKSFSIMLILIATSMTFGEGDSNLEKLLNAKTIRCYLDKGAQTDWSKGKLNIKIAKFSKSEEDSYITFDSINIKKGTARMIGNIGSVDVSVIATNMGLTFIHQADNGSLTFTTIYSLKDKVTNRYLTVNSRHVLFSLIEVVAMPSQYYGTSKILEYDK